MKNVAMLFSGFPASTIGHGRISSLPLLSVVFALVVGANVFAQQNIPVSAKTEAPKNTVDDSRYRIGPGDVLAIIVRKAPELSQEAVRVDQRGMIRIPMIKGEINAACRTESELANQVATLYLEYKNDPSVEVFVREFQSRPVSVIGAINSPGQFRLQRQVRLLELLSFAGGPAATAGRVINVIHAGGPNICEKGPSSEEADANSQGIAVFKLNDTLKGKEDANPFVQPGDIVQLPEADQVFVVGYVMSPRAIPLKDKQITVSRAVAMAGGPQRESKTSKIKIVRQIGDGQAKQEIIVDLGAIQKQKAVDVVLFPDDIVEVPSSTGKIILSALTGSLAPMLTQGAIRAIP
jgi:polysaccharide export outer membrane protein